MTQSDAAPSRKHWMDAGPCEWIYKSGKVLSLAKMTRDHLVNVAAWLRGAMADEILDVYDVEDAPVWTPELQSATDKRVAWMRTKLAEVETEIAARENS